MVQNADLVRDWFGYWPTFHDAHLVAFSYQAADDAASFTLHAFEMTDRVSAEGFFELVKHCLVTFHVTGSVHVDFQNFALGNTLFGLQVAVEGKRLVLQLDSAVEGQCVLSGNACSVDQPVACDAKGVAA
jgi:hypothetical protein